MTFLPPRRRGMIIGTFVLLAAVGAIIMSLVNLAQAGLGPQLIVWVVLPLIALPLAAGVVYRLYGLFTARYDIDRDGFYLRWGAVREQIPLSRMRSVRRADQGLPRLPWHAFGWPGCRVGRVRDPHYGVVEYYATLNGPGIMLIDLEDRWLAISPCQGDDFSRAFVECARMGSLHPVEYLVERPELLSLEIWRDPLAGGLIGSGLLLVLLLLGFLAARASGLPGQVPFGFEAGGLPGPMAPPGRLLLLPIAAGACWMLDALLGSWIYRREGDRVLAYMVWATALIVGGIFWGASLQLLAAV
jgi:hypothetical protein